MICPYCNHTAIWCENKEIYGKNYGKSYMCYLCKNCDAYVGCHKNSTKPLGTMANKELRMWRQQAHKSFDPIWMDNKISRRDAYTILKVHFKRVIHIGESDIETCKEIIKLCNSLYEQ